MQNPFGGFALYPKGIGQKHETPKSPTGFADGASGLFGQYAKASNALNIAPSVVSTPSMTSVVSAVT